MRSIKFLTSQNVAKQLMKIMEQVSYILRCSPSIIALIKSKIMKSGNSGS